MEANKMDEEARRALLRSIFGKWENILSCKGIDKGSKDCPLCELFNREGSSFTCIDCPVFLDTGEEGCLETPYSKWENKASIHDYYGLWVGNRISPTTAELAVKEQEYLISLLPQKDIDNLETLYKNFVKKENLK